MCKHVEIIPCYVADDSELMLHGFVHSTILFIHGIWMNEWPVVYRLRSIYMQVCDEANRQPRQKRKPKKALQAIHSPRLPDLHSSEKCNSTAAGFIHASISIGTWSLYTRLLVIKYIFVVFLTSRRNMQLTTSKKGEKAEKPTINKLIKEIN